MASCARVTRPRTRLIPTRRLVLGGALAMACGGSPPDGGSSRVQGEPAKAVIAEGGSPEAPPAAVPALDPTTLPGSILFVSERDGDLEIYRWRPGVAADERITQDPRADFVVEVAPAGAGLTRVVTEEGATPEAHLEQIVWMPREGEPVLVGPAGRRAREPSWAPDRSFVVFESDAEQAFSDLWRWEPGGALRRLTTTTNGAFEPAVSPDGRRIAFVSTQDGNPELYVMAADGTAPRRLTNWRRDDISPRWSPDGTHLAFLRREQGGERLFVLALREGEPPVERRLVPTAEGERCKHADHTWSPDGAHLAYAVHRPNATPHIAVTALAAGSTRVVSPPHLRATMPSWAPDGRYLAFTGGPENRSPAAPEAFTATKGDPAALDLHAVRLEDGAWARLTSAPAPDWLPRWTAS
jgi:TolB protein